MKVSLNWIDAMKFVSHADGNQVMMDAKAPIGQGTAMTPKELVGAGLGGCTAMDVIALFKKHKQRPDKFEIHVDIETSKGVHPAVFTKATVTYTVAGDVSKEVFVDAVVSSQTKYCGVTAMLSKALPIYYRAILNNETILEGQAQF